MTKIFGKQFCDRERRTHGEGCRLQGDGACFYVEGERALLLLLLLLSRFSHVWLCATPQTAAHQAPLPLGFSRQKHWSGLPFPSPMHESEKWKWSHSVMSDPQRPRGLQPTRLLHPWDSPGKSTGVGCHCFLRLSKNHYLWPKGKTSFCNQMFQSII